MKAKILNILLFITFMVTILAPLTGLVIHKLASMIFLLLCLIHAIMYREKMNRKRYVLLGMIFLAFISGIVGMILDEVPMILAVHKALSILLVFALAIHIFVFHKRLERKRREPSA